MDVMIPIDWIAISNDCIDPNKQFEHEKIREVMKLFKDEAEWESHVFCFKETP